MTQEHQTHSEYGVSSGWSGRGNLQNLVTELKRRLDTKIDFVADTRQMRVAAHENGADDRVDLSLLRTEDAVQLGEWIPSGGFHINEKALIQIGDKSSPSVPSKFLRQLAQFKPTTACNLLNDMLQMDSNRRLVRCLDGNVRAFLSDRYRCLDNYDLAISALAVAKDVDAEVIECSLSDTHMRIKFTSRQIWDKINERRNSDKGGWYAGGLGNQEHLRRVAARSEQDLPGGPGTIHPLVTISNSETGHGGLGVRIGILRAICFNLATVESVVGRVHLGGQLDAGILSREAIEADSRSIMLKCRDSIRAAFDEEHFKRLAAKCRDAQNTEIHSPQAAIESVIKNHDLTEDMTDDLLRHFMHDGDSTVYGLAQAVSRLAQDVPDGDRAVQIEDIAGALISSPRSVLGLAV